ncbi:hypothetical protein [Metabacillus iocasae]|uniref:DnaJ-class molecular chaperone n=1 Tax=Priestia iocasae TaxID=2291674 RepID=A0ABS2QV11_9BACI|nr:hypothetical protein [Metabacillus iocasae]MBM7703118.1 DnaJ-class molecular chaperone [Metabacillus iocasae]
MTGFEIICPCCKGLGKVEIISGVRYTKTCKCCLGSGLQQKKEENPPF